MGKRVKCEMKDKLLINEHNQEIDGIVVECSECGCKVEAFGVGEKSLGHALRELNQKCPEGENNYYVVED